MVFFDQKKNPSPLELGHSSNNSVKGFTGSKTPNQFIIHKENIMKNTNIHAQNLNAEKAAQEALEAKNANRTEVEAILAREKDHTDTVGVFETVKLFQEGKRFNVKLKVLSRKPQEGEDLSTIEVEEMPIGCATTKEDVVAMIKDLRVCAPNGQLLTRSDVFAAMNRRMFLDKTSSDIVEAGINPERKIMVDNEEFFVTNGTEIRRASNSQLVKTLNYLPTLNDEAVEELVVPVLRAMLEEERKPQEAETNSDYNGPFTLIAINNYEEEEEIGTYDLLDEAEIEGEEHKNYNGYIGYRIEDVDGNIVEKEDF